MPKQQLVTTLELKNKNVKDRFDYIHNSLFDCL